METDIPAEEGLTIRKRAQCVSTTTSAEASIVTSTSVSLKSWELLAQVKPNVKPIIAMEASVRMIQDKLQPIGQMDLHAQRTVTVLKDQCAYLVLYNSKIQG